MARVIELNDIGITLVEDGRVLATSPGYALLEDSGALLGEAARAVARVQPLKVNHQFWHELSTQVRLQGVAGAGSYADLAYLHLRELLQGQAAATPTTFLVPTATGLEQLGLLRAIVQAAGIEAARFVDTAVAAARALPGSGKQFYVDLELHRATVTELHAAGHIERGRVLTASGAGQLAFLQRTLEFIARDMVRETRFDPLRQGDSEQALFDALPQLVREAAVNGRVTIALGGAAGRQRVELNQEQLIAATAPLVEGILTQLHRLRRAGETSTIGVGAQAAALPGLAQRLAELPDTECYVLEPASAIEAVSGAFAVTDGDTAERVTALPSVPEAARTTLGATAVLAAQAIAPAAPSHLLYRGQAVALDGEWLTIGTAAGSAAGTAPSAASRSLNVAGATAGVSRSHCTLLRQGRDLLVFDHSSYGTWLNDERIAHRARLRAGDRLRLGAPGIVLELIAIES